MLEILLPSLNDGNNCKTFLGLRPVDPQLFLEGATLIRQRLLRLDSPQYAITFSQPLVHAEILLLL